MKPVIFAICGSTRAGSTNDRILQYISHQWRDVADIQRYPTLSVLPYFDPELTNDKLPDVVLDFHRRITAASGVLICSPEYVFSPPGILKNALEWLVSVTVTLDKPMALIVAAGNGEKAMESLTLILSTLGAKWNEERRLLIQGARGKARGDDLISDKRTILEVNAMMKSFIESLDSYGES